MTKPAGGRPKAAELWEHVTVLPGEKQVRCKYCAYVFAASANRIKYHIKQIPGHGIRICPNAINIISDLKEKDQLPDSQDAEKGMIKKPCGRPKADNMWEHVTVLEGKKQVKCKHCALEFAASANRIKCHINQIKGMGIRPCPKYKRIMRDPKEKEDLLDSQVRMAEEPSNKSIQLCPNPENTIVDPKEKEDLLDSRGANRIKSHIHEIKGMGIRPYPYPQKEKDHLLDSEGIKALQQVQISGKDMHQERIKVGPFYVSNIVNEHDRQMILYVFERSSKMHIHFSSSRSFLYQYQLATLGPQAHLDSWIIDIFADILTEIERRRTCKPLNWYLPVKFSSAALSKGDVSSFLEFSKRQNMIGNYMSDLVDCEKIFIPVHVGKNSCGHYYLYIIQMKNHEVEIWDSLSDQFVDKTERVQTTQKLLLAMDRLFGDGTFTEFYWRMADNILLQPNGYDCGVFVINYMQQVDNYVRKTSLFQFDSDEERLNLALKLLKSDFNQEREALYVKAARMCYTQVESEEDLNLCGITRKRVDEFNTFQDVGRGYWELGDPKEEENLLDSQVNEVIGDQVPNVPVLPTDLIDQWRQRPIQSPISFWSDGCSLNDDMDVDPEVSLWNLDT